MDVHSVLVTGANRGIGLEFVKQIINLPEPPRFVFATYRSSSKVLEDIRDSSHKSQVILIQLDVTKQEEVEAARKTIDGAVKEKGLTLLINNAAVLTLNGFPDMTVEDLLFNFTANTAGPYAVFKEMYPLLQKAAARKSSSGMNISRAAVLNISSRGGSIAQNINRSTKASSDGFLKVLGYRTSKAALNMVMRIVSVAVKEEGILVVQMCPGWVRTDMGTDQAELHVSESVSSMLTTLQKLDETHQGAFMDRNGKTIPF